MNKTQNNKKRKEFSALITMSHLLKFSLKGQHSRIHSLLNWTNVLYVYVYTDFFFYLRTCKHGLVIFMWFEEIEELFQKLEEVFFFEKRVLQVSMTREETHVANQLCLKAHPFLISSFYGNGFTIDSPLQSKPEADRNFRCDNENN